MRHPPLRSHANPPNSYNQHEHINNIYIDRYIYVCGESHVTWHNWSICLLLQKYDRRVPWSCLDGHHDWSIQVVLYSPGLLAAVVLGHIFHTKLQVRSRLLSYSASPPCRQPTRAKPDALCSSLGWVDCRYSTCLIVKFYYCLLLIMVIKLFGLTGFY